MRRHRRRDCKRTTRTGGMEFAMLAAMTRTAAAFAFLLLLPVLTAQQTLAELERTLRDEVQQLAASSPTPEQRDEQLQQHTARVRSFVEKTARGQDRWNGRLMLADLLLAGGDRDGAVAALGAIDQQDAAPMVLITAATMLQHLRQQDLRTAMIEAAVGRDAPLEERLAMARLLMTVLHEVARGEAIFTKALADAKDDEQRAFVRWHRADALRDREDLPENAGFDELEKLSKDLPDTYWGSVAKDRLRFTRLQVGDEAIHFRAETIDGKAFDSRADGKALVLAFYSAADFDTPRLIALLEDLQQRHQDLRVVGVCLDRGKAEVADAARKLGIDFPVIGDGKGALNDVALRWFAEGPTVHVLDKQGRVAGLGLQTGTGFGRREFQEVVERVLD